MQVVHRSAPEFVARRLASASSGPDNGACSASSSALRAACRCADGIGEPTKLLPAYLVKLKSNDPRDFIPAVYRGAWDKAAIAGLAPIVLELAAAGDNVALAIFETETLELFATGDIRDTHTGPGPIEGLVLELGDKAAAITPATIFAALYP
jgi:hypothetical protein